MEVPGPLGRNHVYSLLQNCERKNDLQLSRHVQSYIIQNGLHEIVALGNYLVRIFGYAGSLPEANQAFVMITQPSVHTWVAVILANVKREQCESVLNLYQRLQLSGMKNSKSVYIAVLKACTASKSLLGGRIVHDRIIQEDIQSDVVVGSAIVHMYSKCGSLHEAISVFKSLPVQNVVSWTTMIVAYAQNGADIKALECFEKMQVEGITPNEVTFLGILKACANTREIDRGRHAHDRILKSGLQPHGILGNALVDMYSKCGSLREAADVFDRLPIRDVVSWGAMIGGCVDHGEGPMALDLFSKMDDQGVEPNEITFLGILKACTLMGEIEQGRFIHEKLIKQGFQSEIVMGSTLLDMYAKCGSLEESYTIFLRLVNQDAVSWGAMIAGYVQHGRSPEALQCFDQMQQVGIKPNEGTFSSILKACTSVGAIQFGIFVHEHVIAMGIKSDAVGNSLITLYSKCGDLDVACNVFESLPNQDVVAWNAMIGGYIHHEEYISALRCFCEMRQEFGEPNEITFLSILKVLSSLGAVEEGRLIHTEILKHKIQPDTSIGSALIDMYAKCGSLYEAHEVFCKLNYQNVISWCTMIATYAQNEEVLLSLEYFMKMQEEGNDPNSITFLTVLDACASIGLIGQGRLVHDMIIERGLHLDVVMGSSLIDMYARCGSLQEASKAFERLPCKNAVSWGAMISGYAQHGESTFALKYFETMQQEGIKPNDVMLTSILIACSRIGLVDEGRWYFYSTSESYGITSSISHCTCILDLLGRAGLFSEAKCLIENTIQTDIMAWRALLSASKLHGNIEMARHCFKQVVNLDVNCASGHVLMSNMYAVSHV